MQNETCTSYLHRFQIIYNCRLICKIVLRQPSWFFCSNYRKCDINHITNFVHIWSSLCSIKNTVYYIYKMTIQYRISVSSPIMSKGNYIWFAEIPSFTGLNKSIRLLVVLLRWIAWNGDWSRQCERVHGYYNWLLSPSGHRNCRVQKYWLGFTLRVAPNAPSHPGEVRRYRCILSLS